MRTRPHISPANSAPLALTPPIPLVLRMSSTPSVIAQPWLSSARRAQHCACTYSLPISSPLRRTRARSRMSLHLAPRICIFRLFARLPFTSLSLEHTRAPVLRTCSAFLRTFIASQHSSANFFDSQISQPESILCNACTLQARTNHQTIWRVRSKMLAVNKKLVQLRNKRAERDNAIARGSWPIGPGQMACVTFMRPYRQQWWAP